MSKIEKTIKTADASGRGSVEGYKVVFPARQHGYTEEEINAVVEVMRNSECQTQGDSLQKFEEDFKIFSGANHAFAVDNCTNALRLAAILCGLKPGDEVIIPAYTFCASAIPFGKTGAKIVWADINKDTWVVDTADIERKITDRTKALVVVHLLGMPADMEAVMKLAEKYGLRVVEDCAQALGSRINGRHVGSFGDFGCFSFHGAKTITTLGEGGMLTVKSGKDAALVPGIRHNGVRGFEGERERYWVPAMSNVDIDVEGVWPENFCLGEAQCAVGSVLLKSVEKYASTIIAQGMKIRKMLADTPEIEFNHIPEGYTHTMHQYIMHFNGEAFGKDRNDLLDLMTGKYGVRCIVQYHPLYRYPLFQKLGAGEQDCPVLEQWWDNSFSFPWWCGMPDDTIEYMVSSLKSAVADLKGQGK